ALKKLSADRISVTPEDLQFGYEANYGERVEVLAIVCDNQRRAQEVWEKARRDLTKETFAKLAETYSSDPQSRALSGAVPPIHRHCGEPLLEREAFRLQPGELSSLIQVDTSFVILFCLGRIKPTAANFEEVKGLIHEDVHRKKQRLAMADVYKEIEEKSTVDNFLAGTTRRPPKPGEKGGPPVNQAKQVGPQPPALR
ncbi:MAG TPA: peptidylprolyl isomerase, partial [Pirellulales bacterium]